MTSGDPTKLNTWEGHGKPQWFYMYSDAASPEVQREDGPDVIKARKTHDGLRFKTREGSTFGWPPDVPFWAIVHCCPGEEFRGDPYGMHTFDCPEYQRQADAYVATSMARPPKPPRPIRPRRCPLCNQLPASAPITGERRQHLRAVAENAQALAGQSARRNGQGANMLIKNLDVGTLAAAVLALTEEP